MMGKDSFGFALSVGDIVTWSVQVGSTTVTPGYLRVGQVVALLEEGVALQPFLLKRRRGVRVLPPSAVAKLHITRQQLEKSLGPQQP
ncbi:hypothetical protein C7I85_16590 [Mesorhizobium soli]|uniref:Uncharacterized protein n=1 Tax=Pseudaminobacter soli (ex Li et al. 2025) TaxID=1295366 RepID=A0A2P7S9S4_9HYPH|nr:hypothetical protein C7I85_16590 [Mesorhizobium soli]